MQALFHFGMFASPSCTRVHHILSVRLQHTLWPGPCGNNLEQLTCSAVWLIQAVQACILKCMHLCNIRRHKDAFKQSFMYTYSIHMMFVWQGLPAWLKLLYQRTFPFMYSQSEELNSGGKKKSTVIVSRPSPLFRYGQSTNATLSGFCLYKACSFWCYSRLWGNVNT